MFWPLIENSFSWLPSIHLNKKFVFLNWPSLEISRKQRESDAGGDESLGGQKRKFWRKKS